MSPNWYKHFKGKIVTMFSGKPSKGKVGMDKYRADCQANWKHRMLSCYYLDPYTYFRRWKVTYNVDGVPISCSFQVKKDGANYENIPLPLRNNIVPTLRLFATIFDLPYRHNLPRDTLLELMGPVLSRMTRLYG